MSLYADLGCQPADTYAVIKAAYRKRAQKAHPDKGGSDEEMARVQHAWDVLGDDERRARYDQTGDHGQAPDAQSMVMSMLANAIIGVASRCPNPEDVDMAAAVRASLRAEIDGLSNMRGQMRSDVEKYTKIAGRFKRKDGGDNPVGSVLQGHLQQIRSKVAELDGQIKLRNDVLELLSHYEYLYRVGKAPVNRPGAQFVSFEQIFGQQAP